MNNNSFIGFTAISEDKTQLNGNYLLPKGKPKAVIIIVHGLGGHSARFLQSARLFASQNYASVSIDLRGHGESEGKRGHAKNLECYLNDIEAAIIKSNELFPDIPKFIYGNSMGGILALKTAINHSSLIKGAILTAPWFKLTKPIHKGLLFILKTLNKIHPKFTISSKVRSSQLRSNPQSQEEARQDPLVHKRISARVFCFINALGHTLLTDRSKISIPILIIHGISDTVTDAKASETFSLLHKETCCFTPLKNTMHEIHMEEDNTFIYHNMDKWMTNILNKI
ncbi:alpha/beta hydrolase [Labilibacter sediminis]|nr:alpha/beta hydrolase [Labilibacter sediminis]